MTLADPFLYLVGNRQAILRLAASPGALGVGALLVLTAGIARNYDHLDLLRNPEWIIAPFLISLISCALVFLSLLFRFNLDLKGKLFPQFTTFLALFWLTAPCAWLYAIPVESFTDLLTATKYNVALLAIVALWRVLIITRAVQVLTKAPIWACFLAILVPASIELLIGSFASSFQLLGIMGGVRLSPHHQFLSEASSFSLGVSFWIAVILTPLLLLVPQRFTRPENGLHRTRKPMNKSVWLGTAVACTAWVVVALPSQPVQQRRHQLQTLIDGRDFEQAISYASEVGEDGFSSWHFLPPDPYERTAPYGALLPHLTGAEPAWLRDVWLKQSVEWLKLRADEPRSLAVIKDALQQVPGGIEHLIQSAPEIREHLRENPRFRRHGDDELKIFDDWLTQVTKDLEENDQRKQ